MKLEKLMEDRQAEIYGKSYLDAVNYTGYRLIGIYHDIYERVILQDGEKITFHKIYYPKSIDRPYFIKFNKRYHLDEFIMEGF